MAHLHPAIRVGGLRRGLWIDTYENEYGQYLQELSDPDSGLHAFEPTTILLALDAHHLAAGVTAGMDAADADAALAEVTGRLREAWSLARRGFRCPVIQQTALPLHLPVLGANEHRLARLARPLHRPAERGAARDGGAGGGGPARAR